MKINFAYFDLHGLETAVFEAGGDLKTRAERLRLAIQLLKAAWDNGLRVVSVGLVWRDADDYSYYGMPALNRYLVEHGPPVWTHQMETSPSWAEATIEKLSVNREDAPQSWLAALRAVPCLN